MKPDPEMREEDERVSLRLKVSELELRLMEEKHKFEVFKGESEERGKLLALKESERYRRELLGLREHVRRLEEDLKTVREREMIDRERMKRLLEEMEMKDAEFNERSVGLKADTRRAQDEAREWMNKLESLKARESVLVDEIARLKKKANQFSFASFERTTVFNNVINIDHDDELPMVTEESVKRKCPEKLLTSTPQTKGKQSNLIVDDGIDEEEDGNDEEEDMLKKKKKLAEMAMAPKKASICSKKYAVQSESSSSGHAGLKEPSTLADIQSPISPANPSQAQDADTGFPSFHERYSQNLGATANAGRVSSSSELRPCRVTRAEKLRSKLKYEHPTFIKTVIQYNVSSSWLCLPSKFCLENLPCHKETMILEDENGHEFEVIYIANKKGFSGGWKLFASTLGLKVGDTLTFELRGPSRFKVYVMKANL